MSPKFSEFDNAKPLGFEIVTLGHPALRKKSKKIKIKKTKNEKLEKFIESLRYTLNRAEGVGLAAPQVGVNVELFITQIPEKSAKRYMFCRESPFKVWINPEYEIIDPGELLGIEGCLSVPGYVGIVDRPKEIKVRALDQNGNKFVEKLTGWNARVFLHEYDHLKGVIYIDNIASGENQSYKYLFEKKAWEKIESQKRYEKDHGWLKKHNLIHE